MERRLSRVSSSQSASRPARALVLPARSHTRHFDVAILPRGDWRARTHAREIVRATDECVW